MRSITVGEATGQKSKESNGDKGDTDGPENHQDTWDQEGHQDDSRELTIDKSGKAAKKSHKLLLFYCCLIHDNKEITLVLIVPNILSNAEERSKKFYKDLQKMILINPDNKRQQKRQFQEIQSAMVMSQLTDAIMVISLSM